MNAAYKHHIVHIAIIIISTYQGNQAQGPPELSTYINTDKYVVFWTPQSWKLWLLTAGSMLAYWDPELREAENTDTSKGGMSGSCPN